ncbi:TPA: hypothetical protein QDC03_007514 [Burkholderia cepacia]|nr:hypothetical protein [Burkholderia cepacia]
MNKVSQFAEQERDEPPPIHEQLEKMDKIRSPFARSSVIHLSAILPTGE